MNDLDRARTLAEPSLLPSSNISSSQRQRPEKFSNVNFIKRDNAIGYERVSDTIKKSGHCMKHGVRFSNGSAQLLRYRCCCNFMHAVTGARLFLLTYVALSVITFTFVLKSAVVWTVIPFVIGSLSVYALCTEKHRYLYPFLIISSVHIILCIVVALLIITFTAASYSTFRQIVGYYMKIRLSDTFIVTFVIISVILFLALSILHLWQVTVVYNCMMYFEQKRYMKCKQCQPLIVKHNCSHGMENGHLNIYHNHFLSSHRCYDSSALV